MNLSSCVLIYIFDLTAPVLDQCLQTWSTPVLGPLWVSKNEGFSPLGVTQFLKGLIQFTYAKLTEAKHYSQQVIYNKPFSCKTEIIRICIQNLIQDLFILTRLLS